MTVDLQFIAIQLSRLLDEVQQVKAGQVGMARDIGEIKNDLRYIHASLDNHAERLEELEK